MRHNKRLVTYVLFAMYAAMMGTTGYVYTLSGDTFTPAA